MTAGRDVTVNRRLRSISSSGISGIIDSGSRRLFHQAFSTSAGNVSRQAVIDVAEVASSFPRAAWTFLKASLTLVRHYDTGSKYDTAVQPSYSYKFEFVVISNS